MGWGKTTVKYFLFSVSLIFAIMGLVILFYGVAMLATLSDVKIQLFSLTAKMSPTTAIELGAFMFIIALIGCCAAILENICLLITYAIIVLFLIIIQVAIAIQMITTVNNFLEQLTKLLEISFPSDFFHSWERTFNCCGMKGATSYADKKLPDFCCWSSPPCISAKSYPGCESVIKEYLKRNKNYIGYGTLIFCIFEIAAALMALWLARQIHSENNE